MNLSTQRLLLRPIQESDHSNVFEGLSHPLVIPYYGVSYKSMEAAQEQMTWYADLVENNTGFWWAVCDAESKEFLGAGGFNDMDHTHHKAEIGFWLLPRAWGNGYMNEAMPAIVKAGFEQFNLHRIEGFVESENFNCKKAMSKLNFTLEGTMKDCEWKNGRYISVDIYACIKH